MDAYYVYMLTNVKRNVIYIGVTNNLENRVNNLYPQEWKIRMTPPGSGASSENHIRIGKTPDWKKPNP